MLSILLIIAILALLICLNALFVAAEFATVSSRRTRINQMAGTGNRFAKMMLPIVEDLRYLDRYVAACQLGITASSLVAGAYSQNVIAVRLAPVLQPLLTWISPESSATGASSEGVVTTVAASISVAIVLIALTILQVVVGELFPKSVALQYLSGFSMVAET